MLTSISIRTALHVAIVVVGIVAGGFCGWKLAQLGEPRRVARQAKPLCEAAIAGAGTRALAADLVRARETLRRRELAIAAADSKIAQLEQEKTDALSKTPDLDHIVVAPGEPWLRSARPGPANGAAKRAGGR